MSNGGFMRNRFVEEDDEDEEEKNKRKRRGRKKMNDNKFTWVFSIVIAFILLFALGANSRSNKGLNIPSDQGVPIGIESGITYVPQGSDQAPQIVFQGQNQQFTDEEAEQIRELIGFLPMLRDLEARISDLELKVNLLEGAVVTLQAADKGLYQVLALMLPELENMNDGPGENFTEGLNGEETFTDEGLKAIGDRLDQWLAKYQGTEGSLGH